MDAKRYRVNQGGMSSCGECGMLLLGREYHPYTACLLFKQTGNSNIVMSSLASVIEYGMMAQRKGADSDQALHDFNTVLTSTGKAL